MKLSTNLEAAVAAEDHIAATTYLTAYPLVTAIVPRATRNQVSYISTPRRTLCRLLRQPQQTC